MPGIFTCADHKYNCPSFCTYLPVYLRWSASPVFQFCILNASIKCQKRKERRDKNICLYVFRCYFGHFAFHMNFETTWKACSVILSPLFTQGSPQSESLLSLSDPGYSKICAFNANPPQIQTQSHAAIGSVVEKVGLNKSVKDIKKGRREEETI